MISFLANTLGKWQLGRKFLKTNRVSEALNLSEIHTAVLIFDIGNKEDYQKVIHFAKTLKSENLKQVEVIGYSLSKEIPQFIDQTKIAILGKEEISIVGIPNEKFSSTWLNKPFDLLVDCTTVNALPTNYTLAFIKAKTKVGSAQKGEDEYFDLLVDIKNNDLDTYMKNVIHFLKMINKR